MGHQINFYATPADIAVLGAAAARVEPMLVLHDRSPTAAPRVLPSLDHHNGTQRQLHFFLVREPDLARVVTEHVPTQGYWIVDVLRSPVVEFSSCFFDGTILRRAAREARRLRVHRCRCSCLARARRRAARVDVIRSA